MPPARPRSASAGGWIPRITARRSSRAESVVSRASRSSSAADSGSVCDQLLGEPDVHADRGHPGLGAVVEVALDPAYLGGGVVEGLGPRGAYVGDLLLELLDPAVAQDAALGERPGPHQRRGGQPPGHQHRPVEQHQQPPPDATVDDGADQVGRPALTSMATGSTESTNPPVAENQQNATSRQRAGSRSQRTGRAAG